MPFSTIDKEEQLAILYQRQGRCQDAEKIWEHRILKGVTEIQIALVNMLEIALQEKRERMQTFLQICMKPLPASFVFQSGCAIMPICSLLS